MKPGVLVYTLLALVCLFSLGALVAFPGLSAISPRGPSIVPVQGTRTEQLGRGSIRYQDIGQGDEALFLLHGFNNQLSAWNAVMPYIGGCGRVVRIDIPGYGGSEWPSGSYSLPEQAARVIEFMDARGLSRATLVGASMGASLSALIGARYPDRVKALLIAAPSGYPGSLTFGGRFRRLYRPGALNRFATGIAGSGLYRRLYPNSKALQAFTVTASYDTSWAAALTAIRAPTLVVWSRGDRAVPFSYAELVTRSIPEATLVPLASDVGHDVLHLRAELIGQMACRLHRGELPSQIASDLGELLTRNGDS